MKLSIKPGDKIYEDLMYLIDNKSVLIPFEIHFGLKSGQRRIKLYCELLSKGFLTITGKHDNEISLGKYELLEDKTIILYDKLHGSKK